MDSDPQSNGEGLADQPAYLRQFGMYLRQESSIGVGLWQKLSNQTVVQIENWTFRLDPDESGVVVARRM